MMRKTKHIRFLAAGLFFIALGTSAFSTSVLDGVDGNCDPGTTCARPWRKIVTPYGSFEASWVSHEDFEIGRRAMIALSILGEVFVLVKLAKNIKTKT